MRRVGLGGKCKPIKTRVENIVLFGSGDLMRNRKRNLNALHNVLSCVCVLDILLCTYGLWKLKQMEMNIRAFCIEFEKDFDSCQNSPEFKRNFIPKLTFQIEFGSIKFLIITNI